MLQDHDVALLQTIVTPFAAIAAMVAVFGLTNRQAALKAAAIDDSTTRCWTAPNAAKAWGERFALTYSAFWITWFGWVVLSGVYERFAHLEYLLVCGFMAAPCFLLPIWLQPPQEASRPWCERYWVKANVWIAIISYVGNYFWTHYFYVLLGARYTMPSWRINDVPIPMFLATHAYFLFYHTLATMALRRWWGSATYRHGLPVWLRTPGTWALVFAMSWFTAFMEAFTIQSFPYYAIADRAYLYSVGGVVYGLYFVVSFPAYARLDEYEDAPPAAPAASKEAQAAGSPPAKRGRSASRAGSVGARARSGKAAAPLAAAALPRAQPAAAPTAAIAAGEVWTLSRTVIDSLGACMGVTILLDLWRIGYLAYAGKDGGRDGLPWMPIIKGF